MIRDDARSLRLPGRFGMVCRDASGPTRGLSRAAERVLFERHGITKETMFANSGWRRRLQAMLGRGMADDGHRPGLVPHGTRPARRASTRTRSARDSAHADGHPARRAIGLVRHDGHPARRAIGLVRPVSGMGVMDRRFSRAPIPMSGDRCALVRVRHGRHGSPVFPRSDTDEGSSVRAGRGSA